MNFAAREYFESLDVPFPGEQGDEEYTRAEEAAAAEAKANAEEADEERRLEALMPRPKQTLLFLEDYRSPKPLDARPEPWPQEARTEAKMATAPAVTFKDVVAFCGEYAPLAYAIEGIVRSGSLYTLTGKTGDGKTGFNVVMTLAVATGRKDILQPAKSPGAGFATSPWKS